SRSRHSVPSSPKWERTYDLTHTFGSGGCDSARGAGLTSANGGDAGGQAGAREKAGAAGGEDGAAVRVGRDPPEAAAAEQLGDRHGRRRGCRRERPRLDRAARRNAA